MEVGGLLLVFRSCSVGVASYSDEFVMCLWAPKPEPGTLPPLSAVGSDVQVASMLERGVLQ